MDPNFVSGGVGLEIVKRPPRPSKKWTTRNLWVEAPNSSRALFLLFFFQLISAAFACIFGIRAHDSSDALLSLQASYQSFSSFFISDFSSLKLRNFVSSASDVNGCLFWGSIFNAALNLIGDYYCIWAVGSQHQKALKTFVFLAILNSLAYGAIGVIVLTDGYLSILNSRNQFDQACSRLPTSNSNPSQRCADDVSAFFDDFKANVLGAGITMIFCSVILFVNAILAEVTRRLTKRTKIKSTLEIFPLPPLPPLPYPANGKEDLDWMEVNGQLRVIPGVGDGNIVVKNPVSVPVVSAALQTFNHPTGLVERFPQPDFNQEFARPPESTNFSYPPYPLNQNPVLTAC